MRMKAVALGAAMFAALGIGLWLFLSPSINRQADISRQHELLESVLAVIPTYAAVADDEAIPLRVVESEVCDDTGQNDDVEPITEHFYEPLIMVEPYEPGGQDEQEPVFDDAPTLVPLNHADFPQGITPIGILTIDCIDLRLPVMEGVDEQGMRIAPGRVPQTAAVGEIGNAVIAGHRNYDYGSMFNRLGEVGIGDIVGFQAMSGEAMSFEVFEILEVAPDNQIAFIQPQNESIITLYTCTPVRVATHRLLIRAIKIEGGF